MNEAQLVLVAALASTQALGTLAVSALIHSCKHAGQHANMTPGRRWDTDSLLIIQASTSLLDSQNHYPHSQDY